LRRVLLFSCLLNLIIFVLCLLFYGFFDNLNFYQNCTILLNNVRFQIKFILSYLFRGLYSFITTRNFWSKILAAFVISNGCKQKNRIYAANTLMVLPGVMLGGDYEGNFNLIDFYIVHILFFLFVCSVILEVKAELREQAVPVEKIIFLLQNPLRWPQFVCLTSGSTRTPMWGSNADFYSSYTPPPLPSSPTTDVIMVARLYKKYYAGFKTRKSYSGFYYRRF